MSSNGLPYILITIAVVTIIRILPVTVIRRRITNPFLRSFLYYVPYVTLAMMTFPAIVQTTQTPLAGAAALVLGLVCAWFGLGLFPVAIVCCAVVFILEAVIG